MDDCFVIKPAKTRLIHHHIEPVFIGVVVIRGQNFNGVCRVLDQPVALGQQCLEMAVVPFHLVGASQQHGLSPIFRKAYDTGVRGQKIGKWVGVPRRHTAVVVIIGMIVPFGEQADRENAAKALQIVQVDVLPIA